MVLPDLQSCVLCEDVRCEFNGMQTLVGVLNIVPTPKLPVNYMRLCIWTRWCSGAGRFHQRSKIVGPDDTQTIAQAEVDFDLKQMEGHATNVHYFGGVQFQQFGLHHVEIYLDDDLKLRFPLPVVEIKQAYEHAWRDRPEARGKCSGSGIVRCRSSLTNACGRGYIRPTRARMRTIKRINPMPPTG